MNEIFIHIAGGYLKAIYKNNQFDSIVNMNLNEIISFYKLNGSIIIDKYNIQLPTQLI